MCLSQSVRGHHDPSTIHLEHAYIFEELYEKCQYIISLKGSSWFRTDWLRRPREILDWLHVMEAFKYLSVWAFLMSQKVKNMPAMQETQEMWVQSLGQEVFLEKKMATTPVFFPEKFHGQRSLVGYSRCNCKESDTTEWLSTYYLYSAYFYKIIISYIIKCVTKPPIKIMMIRWLDQCKEIQENHKMGKTWDLFKKIRDTKGTFHAKMDTMKDRNGIDLTEAEDIKKRWPEYIKELYKKDPHDPDNHDGVITHLKPDILECEDKWP